MSRTKCIVFYHALSRNSRFSPFEFRSASEQLRSQHRKLKSTKLTRSKASEPGLRTNVKANKNSSCTVIKPCPAIVSSSPWSPFLTSWTHLSLEVFNRSKQYLLQHLEISAFLWGIRSFLSRSSWLSSSDTGSWGVVSSAPEKTRLAHAVYEILEDNHNQRAGDINNLRWWSPIVEFQRPCELSEQLTRLGENIIKKQQKQWTLRLTQTN